MIPALVWILLGMQALRHLALPLGFSFFAVPAGDSLIPWLQDFTAWFAVWALRITGIPVVLEGHWIAISSGTWEVAEACSGIRYLISSVALGTLFAFTVYKSWRRRAALIGASIVVPILANGVRAYSIILIAHKLDARLAEGIDHLIYGWLFFSLISGALLSLGFRWHELDFSGRKPNAAMEHVGLRRGPSSGMRLALAALAAVSIMASGVLAAHGLGKASLLHP